MASEVRRGRPEDVKILGELSDRVFRPNLTPGTGMPQEFPRLFHAANAQNLYYVADDQDRPVSLVATYKSLLAANGALISAISIGSVATLVEHRGYGYATQILETMMRDARPDHSLMLVSGGRNLYLRLGCVPFGHLIRVDWPVHSEGPGHGILIREVEDFAKDVAELHRVYRSEPYRYLRTWEEMAAFLQATKAERYRARPHPTRVFVAESAGRALAYVVAAPSRDGSRVDLVEWAGDRAQLMALANRAGQVAGAKRAEWLLQPDDLTLRGMLASHGIAEHDEANEGTLLILNVKRLVDEVNPVLKERTGQELKVVSDTDGKFVLSGSGEAENAVPQLPGPVSVASLGAWFFTDSGLNLPLPDTAGLNFV